MIIYSKMTDQNVNIYIYILYLYYTYAEHNCTFSIDSTMRKLVQVDCTIRTNRSSLTCTNPVNI
jgi:hypothetical protein